MGSPEDRCSHGAATAVGEPDTSDGAAVAAPWRVRVGRGRGAAERAVRRLTDSRFGTPKAAVTLSLAGLVLLLLVGASAPNVNTLLVRLPLSLLPSQPAWITYPALVAAVVLEGAGLVGMLWSHSRGWSPNPWRLYGLSALFVLVAVNLTPVGSSDPASYAAYGRLAALGYDPYTTTPGAALHGTGYDALIGTSWQHTPSVYGPVATWLQTAAAWIGGDRAWLTVWMLMIAGGLVFLAVGWLLLRTSDDPVRATLLWTANPLLLQQLVTGGHLDTYVAAGTICALQLTRRGGRLRREEPGEAPPQPLGLKGASWRDITAGIVLGLTAGVKIDAGLVALGLAWPLIRDRQWRRLTAIGLPAAVTLVGVYATYGLHTLAPLSAASKLVSLPTIWDIPWWIGRTVIGGSATLTLISVLWPLVLVSLLWSLGRRVGAVGHEQAAYAALVTTAWIFAAPWAMPWYSAPAWVALTQVPLGRLTRWLLAITVILALIHSSGGHPW